MTDIVERECCARAALYDDMQAEIERLDGVVGKQAVEIGRKWTAGYVACREAQRAELEWLRTANQRMRVALILAREQVDRNAHGKTSTLLFIDTALSEQPAGHPLADMEENDRLARLGFRDT